MTTVLEQKVREAAEAIVDTFRQFNGRLERVERLADELKHLREQLKLTYEAVDKVLETLKLDEERHERETPT